MAITTYTAGQVLTAASLNNNFASGGLQFIKSQTIGSAVASVEVTDAFSATYDNYRIILTGGVASTQSNLKLTFGASATGYYYSRNGFNYANTDASTGYSNQTGVIIAGTGTTSALFLDAEIASPFLAEETIFSSVNVIVATGGASWFVAGYLNNTTSHTAFTITPSTGTITGGTIRVYGYAND